MEGILRTSTSGTIPHASNKLHRYFTYAPPRLWIGLIRFQSLGLTSESSSILVKCIKLLYLPNKPKGQHGNANKQHCGPERAANIGSQGVSSSLWFPISHVTLGKPGDFSGSNVNSWKGLIIMEFPFTKIKEEIANFDHSYGELPYWIISSLCVNYIPCTRLTSICE